MASKDSKSNQGCSLPPSLSHLNQLMKHQQNKLQCLSVFDFLCKWVEWQDTRIKILFMLIMNMPERKRGQVLCQDFKYTGSVYLFSSKWFHCLISTQIPSRASFKIKFKLPSSFFLITPPSLITMPRPRYACLCPIKYFCFGNKTLQFSSLNSLPQTKSFSSFSSCIYYFL